MNTTTKFKDVFELFLKRYGNDMACDAAGLANMLCDAPMSMPEQRIYVYIIRSGAVRRLNQIFTKFKKERRSAQIKKLITELQVETGLREEWVLQFFIEALEAFQLLFSDGSTDLLSEGTSLLKFTEKLDTIQDEEAPDALKFFMDEFVEM